MERRSIKVGRKTRIPSSKKGGKIEMAEIKLTEKEQEARKRVCLALDNIDSVDDALSLARELTPYIGLVKVGKELNQTAVNEGRRIVHEIYDAGTQSFLDLKLHDTPNTVYRASKACIVPGVQMFNVHLAGGEAMCRKAVDASHESVGRINF